MRTSIWQTFSRFLVPAALVAGVVAVGPSRAGMMSGAKLSLTGIPGNLIAVGDAADVRYEALRDAVSSATFSIRSLSNPSAARVTQEVNAGRRSIDAAARTAARRLNGEIDRRVDLLWLDGSINWRQVLQVDLVRDRLIRELYTLATEAKGDLRTYANDRKKSARLAASVPGVYDVRIDGDRSRRVVARLSLEPDFRVTGVVFIDDLGPKLGNEAAMDLSASFDDDEIVRGLRWYVTKGKLVIVGPHFRTSASVTPTTRNFTVTGLDLLPELADTLVNNPVTNGEIRRVKNGLKAANDRLAEMRLRLTKR